MRLRTLLPILVLFALNANAQTKEDSLRLMNESIKAMFDTKDIVVEPSYTFQHLVRYQSHKLSWKGPKDELIDVRFSAGSGVLGVGSRIEEDGHSAALFVVYDHPHLTSLTFMDADEQDVCMRMRIPEPWGASQKPPTKYTRTGATRTIAGVEAHQWTADTGTETVELWVAPVSMDLRPMHKAWGKLNGQPLIGNGDFENGLVLAGSLQKKEGTAPYAHFEAVEVKLHSAFTFTTAGYAVQ